MTYTATHIPFTICILHLTSKGHYEETLGWGYFFYRGVEENARYLDI